MIRAIVFDLDDTLYDCLHENDKAVEDTVRYVANELLHIDEVTVMKAFEEGRDMVKDQLSAWDMAAQHNRVLYFQKMLEILGVSPFRYDLQVYNYFWNNFLNKISIFPGALEFIDDMKARGIKIGICTDTNLYSSGFHIIYKLQCPGEYGYLVQEIVPEIVVHLQVISKW